jgi:hypothetical protein
MNCHLCGAESEFTCESCGENMCENCQTPYDSHTQIDYNCCNQCGGSYRDSRNDWLKSLDEEKEVEKKKKEIEHKNRSDGAKKAAKTRKTPEYLEKKRLKKQKESEDNIKMLTSILSKFKL